MKKISTALASLLAVAALMVGVTACGTPCSGLTASDRDLQAAADDYEVEKEDALGNECELNEDGTWSVDD